MDRSFFDHAEIILRTNHPGWFIWYSFGTGFPYRAEWYAKRDGDETFVCANTAEEMANLLSRVQ